MKNKKFELASTNTTDQLQHFVDRVLKSLGHQGALVTDESYISDFLTVNFFNDPKIELLKEKQLAKAKKKLKIDIDKNELVVKTAKRLMQHGR